MRIDASDSAETAGVVFYLHDGLGSTVALTDATGAKVESYTYDVFGTVTVRDAGGSVIGATAYANRFAFTGREWIQEIGIYDYRNRVYSAELGRFLQTDPIRFEAGDMNLYRYVGNNSALKIDSLGLETEDFTYLEGGGYTSWDFTIRFDCQSVQLIDYTFNAGVFENTPIITLYDEGVIMLDSERHEFQIEDKLYVSYTVKMRFKLRVTVGLQNTRSLHWQCGIL